MAKSFSTQQFSTKMIWFCTALGIVGFLLVFIAPLLAVIFINPLELTKQSRDAVRISNLTVLNQAVKASVQQGAALCHGTVCEGISTNNPLAQANDGTGWVKVDLSKSGVEVSRSLLDPVNTGVFYYSYCTDGKDWEIDAKLESTKLAPKAQTDQGDDPSLYEVGTNLALCKSRSPIPAG